MSTQRDEALKALRAWSAPGRRAELIAAAWKAGATRVAVLAEAARVSRPTVYTDLRSQGIDPDRRPSKESTMQITPVTLEGFTGLNLDGQEAERFRRAVYRYSEEHSTASGGEEAGRLVGLIDILRDYNTLRPLLLEERIAREERERALHLVESRWEALETAPHWLAAHHSYVMAVDGARIAIDMWEERASAATKVPFRPITAHEKAAYEQILAAGHPAIEPLGIDPSAAAAQHRANLEQSVEYRQGLAAQTLALVGTAEAR